VAELPTTPDLAVLATPPAAIPGLIADLGARGCRAAIVVTAGFGEGERAEGEREKAQNERTRAENALEEKNRALTERVTAASQRIEALLSRLPETAE
jgi:acyl-CoA synthetase (NDP forming)